MQINKQHNASIIRETMPAGAAMLLHYRLSLSGDRSMNDQSNIDFDTAKLYSNKRPWRYKTLC